MRLHINSISCLSNWSISLSSYFNMMLVPCTGVLPWGTPCFFAKKSTTYETLVMPSFTQTWFFSAFRNRDFPLLHPLLHKENLVSGNQFLLYIYVIEICFLCKRSIGGSTQDFSHCKNALSWIKLSFLFIIWSLYIGNCSLYYN